jgi:hypothetical protein
MEKKEGRYRRLGSMRLLNILPWLQDEKRVPRLKLARKGGTARYRNADGQ